MKNIIKYALACFMAATVTSCSDFFDRDPFDKLSAPSYFSSEKELEMYANGLVQNNIPSPATICYSDQWADYLATNISTVFLHPGNGWGPDDQTGWDEGSWKTLRAANYMLDNMSRAKDVVSEEVYNHYEGVARFWRAWTYFGKVKSFGNVPWYEHVLDPEDQDLYKPRDDREYVMDKVLADLDFAADNCLALDKYTVGSAQINKWVALAFKSRVCLFEGTYRLYHTQNPSTQEAWSDTGAAEKFLKAAVEAAEELMLFGPYSLHTGNPETAYRELFTSEDLITKEVIWGNQYNNTANRLHDITWRFTTSTYGQKWSLTKNFMNTYLMLNGTPFTDIAGYETIEFSGEFDNRDNRMKQTVLGPEYQKKIAGVLSPASPDFTITRTGYMPIKWNIDDDVVEGRSISWNSLPIIRYGEVLLNYAEAKAELARIGKGTFDNGDWNKSIAMLRARAGVAATPPATADGYMMSYFNNTVTDMWLLEIRRERGIEMVLEMGLRYDDIMRWHMGELLEREWKGIYISSTANEYDFNGDGKVDLKFKGSGPDEPNAIAISAGPSLQGFSLTSGTSGNLVYTYNREWTEKKYLRPIPTSAIVRNNNIEQNKLWQ